MKAVILHPLLALAIFGCTTTPSPPDLVLYNGKIFTADTAQPWVEAVLIQGERIAQVGTSVEMLDAAGSDAQRIDLEQRTVVPGFNDAHDHVAPFPPAVSFLTSADPLPDPAIDQVLDSVRAIVAREPAGTSITTSVGERILSDPRARRAELDRVAPEHPVVLAAWTGHGQVLNSAALAAVGLTDDVQDPLGGRYERDGAGRPTGLLEEYASYNLWSVGLGNDSAAVAQAYQARAAQVVQWGITSVQSFGLGMTPAVLSRVLPALDLPVRLRIMRFPVTTPEGREVEPWEALTGSRLGSITVSGTKWVLDGTPIERLAVHRAPYSDRPGWYGRLNFPPDTLRAMVAEAWNDDDQSIIHAVGDSAVGLVLSTLAAVRPADEWRMRRPRIEHGDGLSPDQYDLARQLGVVIVQNPSHLALGPMVAARYGSERLATFQPLRSLLQNGIVLAFGSDGPLNPFLNLMFAVLHPDNPSEAINMEQAVRAYTWGSAYAEFMEDEKGRLVPGQLADLAVLSQDIFSVAPTELPATSSVLTLVGGRAVYDPEGLWQVTR